MLNMNMPKVSIVIPVYNGSNYLREAIDSALNQTYKNIEVIVVNDGSTDDTEEIALSYGDRIRYFSKENGGVASALNLGIMEMKGEYFSWLSHDDIYLENKIEKQIAILNEVGDPFRIVFGSWIIKEMNTGRTYLLPPEYRFSIEQKQNSVFPVLFGLVNGCTLLIHKSHFERVGVFDESLLTSQDYDLWFRLMRNQETIYSEDALVIQRRHNEQGSNTILEFKRNCEELYKRMVRSLDDDEINSVFDGKYKFYYEMMRFATKNEWRDCFEEFYELFLKEKQSGSQFKLETKQPERLILYCAGRNGICLRQEFFMRGIDIDNFCDANTDFHGKSVDGIICISPQLLKKNDYIIVTKDNPEGIISTLKAEGFEKVIGYSDLAKKLFKTVPIRERVVLYYESYKWGAEG